MPASADEATIYGASCAAEPGGGSHKGVLQYSITNTSPYTKFYQVSVGPHGDSGKEVPANSTRTFDLKGIPDGIHRAEVRFGSFTVVAARDGLRFECVSTQISWGSPQRCDAFDRQGLTVTVRNRGPRTRRYKLEIYSENGELAHASGNIDILSFDLQPISLQGIPTGRNEAVLLEDGAVIASRDFVFDACARPSTVTWGSPGNCDNNDNRGLIATVSNNGLASDYVLNIVALNGERIHWTLNQRIDAGARQEILLNGIPPGDTYDAQILENGRVISRQRVVFDACIRPSTVSWGEPESCDNNDKRSLTATVSNNGLASDYILNIVAPNREQIHRTDNQRIGAGLQQDVVLDGIPSGDDYEAQILENGRVISRQQITFLPCSPIISWNPAYCDSNDNGGLVVDIENYGSDQAYKLGVYDSIGQETHATGFFSFVEDDRGFIELEGIPTGTRFEARLLTENNSVPIATRSVYFESCTEARLPYRMNVLSLTYLPRDPANPDLWDQSRRPLSRHSVERYDDLIVAIRAGEQLVIDSMEQGSTSLRGSGQRSLDYNIVNEITYDRFPPVNRLAPVNGAFRPDYHEILQTDAAASLGEADLCNYINRNNITEVWIWTDHDTVTEPIESQMSSPFGRPRLDISNSGGAGDFLPHCNHTYVMYNYNFTRDVGSPIHNHLHQIENMLGYSPFYEVGTPARETDRRLFDWEGREDTDDPFNSLRYRIVRNSWATACGDAHWLPTSIRDPQYRRVRNLPGDDTRTGNILEYDYDNESGMADIERFNRCSNWNPQNTGRQERVSCRDWNCNESDYYVWWMQRIPGDQNGLNFDGRPLRNWWTVFADFDSVVDEPSILLED